MKLGREAGESRKTEKDGNRAVWRFGGEPYLPSANLPANRFTCSSSEVVVVMAISADVTVPSARRWRARSFPVSSSIHTGTDTSFGRSAADQDRRAARSFCATTRQFGPRFDALEVASPRTGALVATRPNSSVPAGVGPGLCSQNRRDQQAATARVATAGRHWRWNGGCVRQQDSRPEGSPLPRAAPPSAWRESRVRWRAERDENSRRCRSGVSGGPARVRPWPDGRRFPRGGPVRPRPRP